MARSFHDRTDQASLIASVAREVIRRLRDDGTAVSGCSGERLVTLETLEKYRGASEIFASHNAVVTPAALEEAAHRGIKIRRAAEASRPTTPNSGSDACDAFSSQLRRKGIQLPAEIEVVWSDSPAADVFSRCAAGVPAAMVTTVGDVDRFAKELNPRAWILDRERLNLTAAVNVARRIAVRGTTR